MEWVETTAKSLEEAKSLALDQLGVAADEAEFDVLEEPRSGLFGRTRGEARVRARVMPAAVRPKQERRNRGRSKETAGGTTARGKGSKNAAARQAVPDTDVETGPSKDADSGEGTPQAEGRNGRTERPPRSKQQKVSKRMDDQNGRTESPVSPEEVGQAAVAFMEGLAAALGAKSSTELDVDGTNLEVRVVGSELGLLVGPGGRTLMAVQDLARVASQRRLGDHDTRLRIDVGGYREKRRESLERFAAGVAAQVIESGTAKALEPMSSVDRKTVHDAIVAIDGVTSDSEGDDPSRRVVIRPE
jgi:spoIIIJ-associated protein